MHLVDDNLQFNAYFLQVWNQIVIFCENPTLPRCILCFCDMRECKVDLVNAKIYLVNDNVHLVMTVCILSITIYVLRVQWMGALGPELSDL